VSGGILGGAFLLQKTAPGSMINGYGRQKKSSENEAEDSYRKL
jgi:hypothetical protein